jgi:hypothetical protein
MYVHCPDVYVHVYTSTYAFWLIYTCTYHIQTCTYMSATIFFYTYMYVKVCTAGIPCTDDYIHFMKCTDIIELCTYTDVSFWFQLFVLPGWLACKQGLAAARCHTYSSSSTLVQSASAFSLLTTRAPAFPAGLIQQPQARLQAPPRWSHK